jgi:hypothetical protein
MANSIALAADELSLLEVDSGFRAMGHRVR